jgi:hypothetical protein
MPMLKDSDIRTPLISYLKTSVVKDSSNEIVVSEMGLSNGKSIVDLAILNGHIHGFEIKSDADSLYRLKTQLDIYKDYFTYVTVVCTKKHLKLLRSSYPKWVGITLAYDNEGTIMFKQLRKPKINTSTSNQQIVRLLWKKELEVALNAKEPRKWERQTKRTLQKCFLDFFEYKRVLEILKSAISSRSNWQVV